MFKARKSIRANAKTAFVSSPRDVVIGGVDDESGETVRVDPGAVTILEGILILTDEVLRNLIDVKVFVDADADDRLIRLICRDINERGRSLEMILERYEKTVKPMHLQFIEPSKRFADIIIPQGGDNRVGIDILTTIILDRLKGNV